jgi:hypothetical protein
MDALGVTIGIILVMIILLLLAFRLSFILAKRAICKVISIFREYNAIAYNKALTLDNMGLAPRSFFSFRILSDYKPWALETLVKSGVIRATEQGYFYLSEDTLNANPNIQTACQSNKVKI